MSHCADSPAGARGAVPAVLTMSCSAAPGGDPSTSALSALSAPSRARRRAAKIWPADSCWMVLWESRCRGTSRTALYAKTSLSTQSRASCANWRRVGALGVSRRRHRGSGACFPRPCGTCTSVRTVAGSPHTAKDAEKDSLVLIPTGATSSAQSAPACWIAGVQRRRLTARPASGAGAQAAFATVCMILSSSVFCRSQSIAAPTAISARCHARPAQRALV